MTPSDSCLRQSQVSWKPTTDLVVRLVDPLLPQIRAEDGRCVNGVDISPFIDNLPFGKTTTNFETPDASGSTSQATNIIEAIEAVRF